MNKVWQLIPMTFALNVNGYFNPCQASRRYPEPNTRSEKTNQELLARAEQKRQRRIERNKRQEQSK